MIIGSNIHYTDNTTSTNADAVVLLKSGTPEEGTVIHAGYQSSGKGQAGNIWESQEHINLLFSIILYPESVSPADQFLISMTISLGICDFIDRYIEGATIKWPNDIMTGNDKIAGILIENSIIGSTIQSTVAGIGLNINQDKFPRFVPAAVSLKMLTGQEYDLSVCLKQLLSDLDVRYKALLYGDRDSIKEDYMSRLYRFNEWSSFTMEGKVFTGRITDVLISGPVRIEKKDGTTREFTFKEFSYLH
jgi:BirA family transcriptional regulator, biotin operon repressor / biotin---[acetyl-CoA-carboxylase] ligase